VATDLDLSESKKLFAGKAASLSRIDDVIPSGDQPSTLLGLEDFEQDNLKHNGFLNESYPFFFACIKYLKQSDSMQESV
jgi:hypothetical protein